MKQLLKENGHQENLICKFFKEFATVMTYLRYNKKHIAQTSEMKTTGKV